jgi:hypothetical protein
MDSMRFEAVYTKHEVHQRLAAFHETHWLIPGLMIVNLRKYLYLRDVRRLQFYGIGLLIDFQPFLYMLRIFQAICSFHLPPTSNILPRLLDAH